MTRPVSERVASTAVTGPDDEPNSEEQTRPDTRADEPAVLDAAGVGRVLGVGRAKVYELDGRDELPEPVVIGRVRRWVRVELLAWLAHGAPKRATWARQWPRVRKEVLRT